MSDPINTRMRASWHDAASALPAQLQGQLRAARREALSSPPARTQAAMRMAWLGVPAALAAVIAVTLVFPRFDHTPVNAQDPITAQVQPVDIRTAPVSSGSAFEGIEGLTLDDDPDFYLWLAGDDTSMAIKEVSHDSI